MVSQPLKHRIVTNEPTIRRPGAFLRVTIVRSWRSFLFRLMHVNTREQP